MANFNSFFNEVSKSLGNVILYEFLDLTLIFLGMNFLVILDSIFETNNLGDLTIILYLSKLY